MKILILIIYSWKFFIVLPGKKFSQTKDGNEIVRIILEVGNMLILCTLHVFMIIATLVLSEMSIVTKLLLK